MKNGALKQSMSSQQMLWNFNKLSKYYKEMRLHLGIEFKTFLSELHDDAHLGIQHDREFLKLYENIIKKLQQENWSISSADVLFIHSKGFHGFLKLAVEL